MRPADNTMRVRIAKPKIPGPETVPAYWHPWRAEVQHAPAWFTQKLRELDGGDELEVVWNPILERWQVFMRSPQFQHPLCWGWKLLFIHQDAQKGYLPLDERLFARLYSASARVHGNAKEYFIRVKNQMEDDKARREAWAHKETIDSAMETFNFAQIKNIGKGNKFSTYHA